MPPQVVEARAGHTIDRHHVEWRVDLVYPSDEGVDPIVVFHEIGLREYDQRYHARIQICVRVRNKRPALSGRSAPNTMATTSTLAASIACMLRAAAPGKYFRDLPIRDALNGNFQVGDEGFEPPTPCASCRCSSQLS